jgi:sugar lactone lactonase YvrE
MADRWETYGGAAARPAAGWSFDAVAEPARLWGANGIVWGAPNQLMVTQVFGSQVTAIDVDSGAHAVYSALGGGIAAPDDGVFGFDGTFFATEPMNATVSARNPDGSYRKLSDELPSINGITMDHERRRLFADEFRPGGRLWELDPAGERPPVVLVDDLYTPNALAMGPDGALWFPQVVSGEIWRYDFDDRKARCAYSDLAAPVAVKFDSTGALLTPESGKGEVTRIDIRSGERRTVARMPRGIDNIAIAPDDRLFVSHFVDGRVAEALPDGSDRVLSASGLVGPYGLAVLPDGRILVADGLSVAILARDGSIERTHTLISDLPTLAVGAGVLDGQPVVLGQRGQVFRCPPGERPTAIAGHLSAPTALCDSGDGGVLVVEQGAGRVVRVDGSGVTGEVVSGLQRPAAAAVDSTGDVWVACADALVQVHDGRLMRRIDELAGALGVATGLAGVAVAHPPSRRIALVDLVSGAVQTLVEDAAINSPVEGARLPHAAAPVVADGDDGFLVGCVGDGSVRRLARAN